VGKVLPSVCALYTVLSSILSEHPDPIAIGAHSRQLWRTALERLIEFRDRGNDGRFHDLSFDAVQRDPVGEVAKLYGALGDELSDDARQRMRHWWTESSKDRTGSGHYDAEDFGLDLTAVADEFAFYTDRFDVPVAGRNVI
jgi:hypothetical protein